MKACVFPGQGSQFVGMCKQHSEHVPGIRRGLDRAREVLGYDIAKIMFEGPENKLNETQFAQPAIFLHSYLFFREAQCGAPEMLAGHSIGEYAALTAAGVFEFEHALQLVQLRAAAMQEACESVKGAMAAIVGMEEGALSALCEVVSVQSGAVWIANLNAPHQIVVAGLANGVDDLVTKARASGAKMAKRLAVSGAFHTPLMQAAAGRFSRSLATACFRRASAPVCMNVDGAPRTDPEDIRAALQRQLANPVRWEAAVRAMHAAGARTFVEIGPGRTLQGLIRRILPGAELEGLAIAA